MSTTSTFPYRLNWTAQDLADAVPLRLFELFGFDATVQDIDPSANHLSQPRRDWRRGYLHQGELPARVRVH